MEDWDGEERRLHKCSEEEHQIHHEFVRKWIQREEKRSAFRQAVIEKSLVSLLYSGILFCLTHIFSYLKEHWK